MLFPIYWLHLNALKFSIKLKIFDFVGVQSVVAAAKFVAAAAAATDFLRVEVAYLI